MPPINISKDIPRFESLTTKQFTFTSTQTVPSTISFVMFNSLGTSLSMSDINLINSGAVVSDSGTGPTSTQGQFYINITLPETRGFYLAEFIAFDSNSKPYRNRSEFEIINSIPTSFYVYGDVSDALRVARRVIGRSDLTFYDIQRYMESAHDQINAHLGEMYTVPISPVFPLLKDIERVYAIYNLYSDLSIKDIPSALTERKREFDDLVNMWGTGSLSLPVQSGTSLLFRTTPESNTEDYLNVFDNRDFIQMRVDPDLIEKQDSEDS